MDSRRNKSGINGVRRQKKTKTENKLAKNARITKKYRKLHSKKDTEIKKMYGKDKGENVNYNELKWLNKQLRKVNKELY